MLPTGGIRPGRRLVLQSKASPGWPGRLENTVPTTDNPLLDILQVTEEWKQLARGQVDDIRGWRDADEADRWYQYWVGRGLLPDAFSEPEIPCRLAALNIRIQSWMLQRAPHLDVSALQKVYWYVSVWHADHNAERLPEQRELQAALEQALIVTCSVETAAQEVEKRTRTPSVLDKLRAAIKDLGRNAKSADVIKRAGVNRQDGLDGLRQLQELHEYDGHAQATKRKRYQL